MKPEFEKITPKFGSSVFVEQHLDKKDQGVPFWHFHPELELVYIDKARGKRHIGNHLSYFNNSQLILIGANLPHSGFADGFNSEGRETIVQFREDFLGSNFLPFMTIAYAITTSMALLSHDPLCKNYFWKSDW